MLPYKNFLNFPWEHVPDAIMAKGEGEIHKRKKWIDLMSTKQPELRSLILWCLLDNPSSRPSTFCLNVTLEEMKKDYTAAAVYTSP